MGSIFLPRFAHWTIRHETKKCMYYKVKPQSLAQLGKNTIYDRSITPWRVTKLHAVFDVWSDDDLLKASPCYFVTERLSRDLLNQKFTGVEIGLKLETEITETFRNLYPNKTMPAFYLLNIAGTAFRDDFALENISQLVLSDRVVSFLKNYNLSEVEIIECC